MTDTIFAKRVFGPVPHDDPYYDGRLRIKGTALLHQLGGNQAPYFSATGETFVPGRRDFESGGCIHDELTRYFPDMIPVIRVHLSDHHGVPMHAYANAAYWAGQSRWHNGKPMYPDDDYGRRRIVTDEYGTWAPDVLANHLRCTPEEAAELRMQTRQVITHDWLTWEQACANIRLPERWQQDATLAIEAMGGLQRELPCN